ncbi:MAG: hypothetical protein HQK66_14445, partial [Desulfamplus sp.]|nr:hypothetical protein [Desulfamplus sp.]
MKEYPLKLVIRYTILFIIAALIAYIVYIERQKTDRRADDALSRIMERGTIRLITENNANCYYIYREESMGFEYEL